MNAPADRCARIRRVVSAVIRQAVADARAEGILLLDAEYPETELARAWCVEALGEARIRTTPAEGRWLTAASATKTTLLLTGMPSAGLLPLGDIYGSEIRELGSAWHPPALVGALAAAAGGVEFLDAALRRWAEERRSPDEAFSGLPSAVASRLGAALRANRFARRTCGLVPKLSVRTLGIDLWD